MATKTITKKAKAKPVRPAKPHSTGRFAHPFFTTTPPAQRKPISGNTRMTDWSKLQLGPVPAVLLGGRMDLAEIIGTPGVTEIEGVGEIRFHALGDSGVGMAHEAELVGCP